MLLPLIAALALLAQTGEPVPAATPGPPRVPAPLSGDPGWKAAAFAGAGAVFLNTAGGQHLLTPELTTGASWRVSPLFTARAISDFSWRHDGAPRIYVEDQYFGFAARADLTLGTDRAQFVAGAGPCAILTAARLHGPGTNVHTDSFEPGFVYGLGLRWMAGRVPLAVDFGGRQRATRHDFRLGFSAGLPLARSSR
jgi:hypothetical protein